MARERLDRVITSRLDRAARAQLRRRSRDPDIADDVVQDAYVTLLEMEDTKLAQDPEGMLFAVANNKYRDAVRKARRNPVLHDSFRAEEALAESNPSDGSNPCEALIAEEDLKEALETLPERYREIFSEYRTTTRTFAEIGEALGLSKHTVKSYYHKAARLLGTVDHPDHSTGD